MLRSDYVQVIVEGVADLADLESRVWSVEVSSAEVWLAEGEVDEDAPWL